MLEMLQRLDMTQLGACLQSADQQEWATQLALLAMQVPSLVKTHWHISTVRTAALCLQGAVEPQPACTSAAGHGPICGRPCS